MNEKITSSNVNRSYMTYYRYVNGELSDIFITIVNQGQGNEAKKILVIPHYVSGAYTYISPSEFKEFLKNAVSNGGEIYATNEIPKIWEIGNTMQSHKISKPRKSSPNLNFRGMI